jgi:predicted short-subunit dehydrogenase-like oxidoreductase (DUF2520 family)
MKTTENKDSPPAYLLIGSGRTAKHLGQYLEQLQLPFQTWKRGQKDLKEKVKTATHILLAISDSEIQNFFQEHLKSSKKTVVHFSGALELKGMFSAHPLMSFSEELYDQSDYLMIPFVLTDKTKSFKDILPGFKNPHFFIKPEDKAMYHALCVLGGNLTTYLWQKTLTGFEKLGLPQQIAHPYMLRLCQNLLSHPEKALTGPLARKDLKTVINNDQALSKTKDHKIYRSFVAAIYPEALKELEKGSQ